MLSNAIDSFTLHGCYLIVLSSAIDSLPLHALKGKANEIIRAYECLNLREFSYDLSHADVLNNPIEFIHAAWGCYLIVFSWKA